MATFNIQGKVVKPSSQLGVSLAKVKVFQQGQTAPIVDTLTGIDGTFNVNFNWAAGRPDVHFKVTQMIDGAEKVIYNENPATQTRVNIADVLSVNLKAEEGLSAAPTSGRPYDTLFVFTRVGVIGVNQIDTVGAAASGYAFPDTSAAAPNSADANSPFGSTLDIAGWFGQFADVYRYKVQYNDGSGWQDVDDPLSNSYYDFVLGGGSWTTVAMGPFTEGGQSNVYKLPYIEKPGQPWIFPDLIARWDTSKVANNLYTLRIQGFKVGPDGTTLVPSTALIIDPSFGNLKLRTDNSAPVVKINSIEHSPSPGAAFVLVKVCEIVSFSNGKLRFNLEASDAQGHLKGYSLAALFGHNLSVAPPPAPPTSPDKAADNYANHVNATRHWNGGTFTVDYDGSVYPPNKMQRCAYQFRLNVTKRTTNGYGNIFAGLEDTVHITINRV